MLRSILTAALLAGTIAGVLFTGIQQFQVTPLILEAEKYELVSTEDASAQHDADEHQHDEGWIPGAGTERLSFTLLANVLGGIGFALLLVTGITLSGHKGWAKGLLWGLAGYAVFFLAPSLGLHPKLPGTISAALQERQIWWLATVATSATGLALLVFARGILLKGTGILFIIIPHVVGAPLPPAGEELVSAQMSRDFIVASGVANAFFWLILGVLSGYLMRKTDFNSQP